MTHQEFSDSLRQIADFYEAHPEMPLPYLGGVPHLDIFLLTDNSNFKIVAKAFGHSEKRIEGLWFMLVKKFGCIELQASEYRDKVCTRRVVSSETSKVEERIPIAYETRIVEKVVEKVEWDCPAIMETK